MNVCENFLDKVLSLKSRTKRGVSLMDARMCPSNLFLVMLKNLNMGKEWSIFLGSDL